MSLFEILESSFCAVVVPEFVLYIEVNEFGCSTDLINVLSDLELFVFYNGKENVFIGKIKV